MLEVKGNPHTAQANMRGSSRGLAPRVGFPPKSPRNETQARIATDGGAEARERQWKSNGWTCISTSHREDIRASGWRVVARWG